MTWLGLVDVVSDAAGVSAFLVHAVAGALAERALSEPFSERAAGLAIDADLTVLVPSRSDDPESHAFLARAGELIGPSPAGLRYRLTAERVQALFDEGFTGPDIVQYLRERSVVPLPPAAVSRIERWWQGYSSIHLYDDVTIVELADDLLLPELLAATSLHGALVHTFSPRLIAVDSAMVDALVGQLTHLGHGPRLVEAG